MKAELVKSKTPEEVELERKKQELAALQTELAERELDLSTLEAELRAFERRYLRVVGILYAQLDEIEAQIAERLARLNPKDTKAQERFSQARTQAKESAEAAGTAKESREPDDFEPPEDLKKLYREVAKTIHPDLATDDNERARRTQLMAEANRAYENGDSARLQAILNEWEGSPEAIKDEGVAAELVRVIRKIALIQRRLRAIEARFVQLKESDLYHLKTKFREAEQQGRDLFAEMAATLDEQIADARKRLTEITGKKVTT